MLTLTVSLQVRPERHADFVAAITENARRTFADEPGCLRFDVARDRDDELHYVFHEVYVDADALEAHRAAPHFAVWRAAADRCVVPGSQVNTVGHLLVGHGGGAS
ncbi:putative quinol monooxygenase [Terracoccus luteus]|uniref:Quinol monooxygenase YgiN n=1 Tax=Terracoccus luteus TaxID=53356 RepID=A0A495Y1A4_9MICO|nr:putative quinol monooxygenase [Terracoccus luteus]MBB2986640.1 quinol monooxygenase YgiN [Terracoccus luteus]MCP2171771.1 quinol monooxygenase YgiN [Terracoccus luteus]RKT79389.1 quinol monooxygenase YgiN [Terracoccus luteus]